MRAELFADAAYVSGAERRFDEYLTVTPLYRRTSEAQARAAVDTGLVVYPARILAFLDAYGAGPADDDDGYFL